MMLLASLGKHTFQECDKRSITKNEMNRNKQNYNESEMAMYCFPSPSIEPKKDQPSFASLPVGAKYSIMPEKTIIANTISRAKSTMALSRGDTRIVQ